MSGDTGEPVRGLSGIPAEAGVRDEENEVTKFKTSLSGTPAEAGVRELKIDEADHLLEVSVEPLPKQGCEAAGVEILDAD